MSKPSRKELERELRHTGSVAAVVAVLLMLGGLALLSIAVPVRRQS